MHLVTAAEMREIDQKTTSEYGISGLVLMENAGLAVYRTVHELLGTVADKTVLVMCGTGNNGGDGLVTARHLVNHGARVRLMLTSDPESLAGDSRVNYDIWQRMGQKVYSIQDRNSLQVLHLALMQADLVIDALYGTGFRGEIQDRLKKLVETVNDSERVVVSVDLPSGVHADTGTVRGTAIMADHTVTFGFPKLGLLLEPGTDYAGTVHVADISIPRGVSDGLRRRLITAEQISEWLKPRLPGAHKGQFGHVLVIGGSRGMVGAACLTARAALKGGAGLVTLAVPRSLQDVAAGVVPEAMTAGLAETLDGTISPLARDHILDLQKKATVMALGPGLSVHPETVEMVRLVLSDVRIPCILDADALNALALLGVGGGTALDGGIPFVLTPHPGEMSRLLGVPVANLVSDRIGTTEIAAVNWGCTVALKGRPTVIAGLRETYVNPTGNPGMATAGSGDVLTGLVSALLAQGCAPTKAMAAAAFVHGLAGDLAAENTGQMSLTAGAIIESIPAALKEVERR
ncbi:MAG: NAD(P)H-hydrate dehydratase [Eubacteriales bacterium]|nr:NAD(P)H-hydrate dehydratase [Bacillota bacterium]MBV1726786.1 NAD(P)H-hydrate dehydratase [Desulforudis sp.]MDZ4042998.1 NAD(P)H-hydrate dehydratase [Eubacteriales bacterium]MBU4554452.1 NAD(P)H-hydrate dehydratase [Bacillota bacterium]MBV1735815.1 NAD(P)H-hydrate dehydratase [Desulforudis sp.]